MFLITGNISNTFESILNKYHLIIATSDVYYQNAKMLNGSHKFLDYQTFMDHYKALTSDIELVTEPIDAFVPAIVDEEAGEKLNEDEVHGGLFVVNRVGPEYEKIDKRVTLEDLQANLPPTHPALIAIMEDGNNLQKVKDDIYIYYSMMKYLHKLDEFRIMALSVMTPAIEYTVENIDLNKIKRYIHTKKINIKKFKKFLSDYMFRPDFQYTVAFYDSDKEDIPQIDVELLLQKLATNIDTKADYTICTAIYL